MVIYKNSFINNFFLAPFQITPNWKLENKVNDDNILSFLKNCHSRHCIFNPLCSGNTYTGILTNVEDPDEIQQGESLHCLLR